MSSDVSLVDAVLALAEAEGLAASGAPAIQHCLSSPGAGSPNIPLSQGVPFVSDLTVLCVSLP
ncbi:hypothetical protein BCAR13_1640012 [Paraburkholderia caribensis]|nr:hypothetical protein BCAR13_1640012 [Paraburkholderia caribensis]